MKIDDWNERMTGTNPDLNFKDPYSRISSFLLYLYTMELGNPPLYAIANRVARDMDLTWQDDLGPFIHGLYFVTMWAEKGRDPQDRITTGNMLGGTENNISGSFLLWRGAAMQDAWIKDYEENIGSSIKFKGFVSTSRNLQVALSFAFDNLQEGYLPVLLSISCSNYMGILGITVQSEACTCYPNEDETVFMDGACVNIWDVIREVKIVNKHQGMERYHGKSVACIYTFHAK